MSNLRGGDTIGGYPIPGMLGTNGRIAKINGALITDSIIHDTGTNIGIGTTTPIYTLQVQKPSGTAPAIMIGGAVAGSPRLQVYGLDADSQAWMGLGTDMGGGPYEHSVYFPVGPSTNGKLTIGSYDGATFSTKLTALANGNIGIGTGSPGAKFHVENNINGGTEQFLRNTNAGTSAYTIFQVGNDTTQSKLVMFVNSSTRTVDGGAGNTTIRTDSGQLHLSAAGGQKMTIDTNGNVGVGTSTPAYKFSVHAAGDVWHTIMGDMGAGVLRIGGNTNNGAVIQAINQSTSAIRDLYLQRDGGKVSIGANNPEGVLQVQANLGTLATSNYAGHLQLRNTDGGSVHLGFHRGGNTAVSIQHRSTGGFELYNNSGTYTELRTGRLYHGDSLLGTYDGKFADINTWETSGFFNQSAATNYPYSSWWSILNLRHTNSANIYGFQFIGDFYNSNLYYRSRAGGNPGWARVATSASMQLPTASGSDPDWGTGSIWIRTDM